MPAHKLKTLKNLQMKFTTKVPVHTPVSYAFGVAAIVIMLYFALRHLRDEPAWSDSSFMQMGLALLGLVGTQLVAEQSIIPNRGEWRKVSMMTGIRGFIIALLGMGIQLISQVVYSFTLLEQAVYFMFSAISEELFFRGFILGLAIKLDPMSEKFTPTKIFGVVVQAVGFTAIHQNYYHDFPMLLSVFIGGLMLGLVYLIWEDLTANILGHFILNVIAVQSLLVQLGGAITSPIGIEWIYGGFLLVWGILLMVSQIQNPSEPIHDQFESKHPKSRIKDWIVFGLLLLVVIIVGNICYPYIEPWGRR